MIKPAMGAAPAISADQKTVYVVVKGSGIEGQPARARQHHAGAEGQDQR